MRQVCFLKPLYRQKLSPLTPDIFVNISSCREKIYMCIAFILMLDGQKLQFNIHECLMYLILQFLSGSDATGNSNCQKAQFSVSFMTLAYLPHPHFTKSYMEVAQIDMKNS